MRTFGSDPEFMLSKGNKIHSAIGIIQGSIDNRVKLSGHEFYYDNVLAECAIKPAASKQETLHNFRECFQMFAEMANPYKLLTRASHNFSREQLNNEEAQNAGCAPDTCAYLLKKVQAPKEQIRSESLRTCGGHIHLGCETLRSDGVEPLYTVYMLDLLLGIPSIWLDKDATSRQRRALYGQAGRYRVAGPDNAPYGIEYRSLGNFWLQSPRLVSLVYDLSWLAVDWVEQGVAAEMWSFDEDLFWELQDDLHQAYTCHYDEKLLQRAINESDRDLAKPFLDIIRDRMPSNLWKTLQESFEHKTGTMYSEWDIKPKG